MEPTEKQNKASREAAPATAGLRSLLVPTDLTPGSDRVLGRVALLPLAHDARVTLLHVVPGSLPAAEQRKAQRDANMSLADEARHLRQQVRNKVTVEPLVIVGAAAKEIAASATEVNAELIVMGRGGGRALRDAFLGSTAERVVRQARLPVLVVRLPPREAYGRPSLAVDLDQAAHEVVRVALLVLPPPRPRIEVIHAFDMPFHGLIYPSLSEDEIEERKDALRFTATHELAKLLAAALEKANVRSEEGPSWTTHVRYGSPRIIVEKALKESDPDLLVLGTHGYSGAAYVFLGTVAGDLLRAARCDVLVVPPAALDE
jgi:nucleotide-binding universal stress UspA family protein